MVEYTQCIVNYYLACLKHETRLFSELVLAERGWKNLSVEEMDRVLEKAPHSSDVGFLRTILERQKENIRLLETDIEASEKGSAGELVERLEKVIEDIRKVKKPAQVYLKRKERYDRIRGYDPKKDLGFVYFGNYVNSLTAYEEVIGDWAENHQSEELMREFDKNYRESVRGKVL